MLPFAGTIRDLVAGKWLRGLSMSWQPIKYRQLPDHSGGLEFQQVDLLEVSVVPLPALASALADARSHGVDVRPLRSWASRALDTCVYRSAPRQVLEAIHRATSSVTTSLPSRAPRDLGNSTPWEDPGSEARRQRARELVARGRRLDRVAEIQARGRTGLTDETEGTLNTAQTHHNRALKHHDSVVKSHESVSDHVSKLRTVHRKLTKTLDDLGVKDRAMDVSLAAFKDHLDGLKSDHEDSLDTHEACGRELNKAAQCVRSVLLGGAEQSEPEDYEGKDPDAKVHDSVEDRAARVRRLRLIQGHNP